VAVKNQPHQRKQTLEATQNRLRLRQRRLRRLSQSLDGSEGLCLGEKRPGGGNKIVGDSFGGLRRGRQQVTEVDSESPSR
jgi:hypothetical protein